MDGWNQMARNVPDSSSTMKLYSAISPSRNDQWSGKTLRTFFLTRVASPTRSSSHSVGPDSLVYLPLGGDVGVT